MVERPVTFGCGDYLVCPYRWDVGNPDKNTKILDAFVEHPIWCTTDAAPADIRNGAAAMLSDSRSLFWEVWDGGRFVGLFLLQHLFPKSDSLFHFVFFDGRFRGRRALILRFLGLCFEEYGFRRITMHVPEFRGRYLDWVRLKLGFKYEGEGHLASLGETEQKAIRAAIGQRPAVWLASIGSRREQTHWHDGKFWDTYVVRVLKDELPMN